MSTEAFEDFYFNICTMNYLRMTWAMMPLEKHIKKADRVHIKGPSTDITFRIKGIGTRMCKCDRNITDGEVFSCPELPEPGKSEVRLVLVAACAGRMQRNPDGRGRTRPRGLQLCSRERRGARRDAKMPRSVVVPTSSIAGMDGLRVVLLAR